MLLRVGCVALCTSLPGVAYRALSASHGGELLAQIPTVGPGSVELDATLFVQAPEFKGATPGTIVVIWLPQPLVKLCLGKTATQCANIDYCIRTTNRATPTCSHLGVDLARIAKYPPGTKPRRMLSVTLSRMKPDWLTPLQDFYRNAPQGSLDVLSMDARVKARIRYDRNANDDGFALLEVLTAPAM